VPLVVAFFGWAYIFLTSRPLYIGIALVTLLSGSVVFVLWSYWQRTWPFAATAKEIQ
jgi:hypothetical protein